MTLSVRVSGLDGVVGELHEIRLLLAKLVAAFTPAAAGIPDSIGDQLTAAKDALSSTADTLHNAVDDNTPTT